MRALRLVLLVLPALACLATSACTQSNTQLPPFYDGGPTSNVDSSMADADDDATTGDGASEATADGPTGDAPAEASGDGGGSSEGGAEAGPGDAGDGGG